MILGIDTSLGTTVAVTADDGTLVAQADSADPLGHAEAIGTLLRRVLDQDPAAASRLTRVAAGMGPGPFTGLRIGIAAARAFARGRGIPVVPVVSHDAIALQHALDGPPAGGGRIGVVTDARRREVAYSVYDGLDGDGLPVRVAGPALAPRADIAGVLARRRALPRPAQAVSAAMIALAAVRALTAGRRIGPQDALYLRSPDVAPPAAPKRVGL